MKFGERRTPHVEGLPIAIKAQANGFFSDSKIVFIEGGFS